MVMKTILYIHGLSSSGASGTARHLQALLPDMRVIAPDLPIDPDEALAMLRDLVATERPDIVIGTSMGGMFAQQLYDCLLYTSPSPRDTERSRMPSSA